jgi:hypothetical protein
MELKRHNVYAIFRASRIEKVQVHNGSKILGELDEYLKSKG